jgi:non-ribosomal peptide synthetase component F
MVLLAGYQTLLMRYSGEDQIVLGTDVANRTTSEAERMIGFFINLLPLRGDLFGNPTFRELLGRVRKNALGAYAHQDPPFDKLVEELQPERKAGQNPIVQALFVMQNTPQVRRSFAGLETGSFSQPVRYSKFDLAVFMSEKSDHLEGHWVFRTDLFDAATIRRIGHQFQALLQSATSNPDARLSALEILTSEEKERRIEERNQRKTSQRSALRSAQPKAAGPVSELATEE